MSRYNEFDYDEWEEYDDMYWGNDDDIDPYDQYLAHNGLDWDDDTSQDDYEDEDYYREPTIKQRLLSLIHNPVWHIKQFWNNTLNMGRCHFCGKLNRFGNHNDCLPF